MPPKFQARVLLTCEHARNAVPKEYEGLFRGAETILRSHRGYDPGSEELGVLLAESLGSELIICPTTRLLVEANRSLHHRQLFSEFTRDLPKAERQRVIERYYLPHRQKVESAVGQSCEGGERVFHISVHSFTPVFNNEVRNADVSLLYDPGRQLEKGFAVLWKNLLHQANRDIRVRFNYPYLGTADGLTTHLRRKYGEDVYLGLELEVNQAYPIRREAEWGKLQEDLCQTLAEVVRLTAGESASTAC